MSQKKFFFNISLANVISTFAVVYMHANNPVLLNDPVDTLRWLSSNVIECVCYFAVPVFLMISGATLMDYRERYSTKQYFIIRCKKTVIPFIFWSIFSLVFLLVLGRRQLADLTFFGVIKGILNTEYMPIYWFFLTLFEAYLLIPVISLIPKEKRMSIFFYVMVVGFFFQMVIPFLNTAMGCGIPEVITFPIATTYMWFIFAGYYFQNKEFTQRERMIIYAVGLFGLLLHMLGTQIASRRAGELVKIFKGSPKLPNLLYTVAVFVLIKEISKKIPEGSWMRKLVLFIAPYSFGIYLTHRYMLNFIAWYDPADTGDLLYRLFVPFAVVPSCIFGVWIIRHIPVVGKYLVP